MTKPTKVPGIPKPPASADPQTRHYLENLAEAVEIRLGRRGDPKDRAVTLRELIDSGLAEDLKAAPFDPNNINPTNIGIAPPVVTDSSVPPAPTSFNVAGAYSQVILSWDYPHYSNHSFTEIYGHDSDVIGDAQLIGVSTGRVYIDPIGSGASRYYWIRHVSTSSVLGPWNSGTGTLGQTSIDVAYQLNVLAGAITSSELATSLATPIGNLPTDTSASISSLQSQINSLSTVAAWASGTSYSVNDLVTFSGNLYEAAQAHTASSSNQPSGSSSNNSYWTYVGAYTSLAAAVAGNTSDITEVNYINASSGSAAAQKIASLDATVTHPTTGVSANATAVSSLDTRVSTAENTITSQSEDITALENTVTHPTTGVSANATAVSGLTSTVSSQGLTLASVSQAVTSLNTTVGNNSSSITSQTSSINGLEAKYVVKTDVNGAVAGFGLASTDNGAGNITSEFIVNADRFAIMRGGTNTAAATVPFAVQATAATINGESVPAGVYMADAFIKNGSIESAKIGSLNASKITAGFISADRINGNSIEASKLSIDNNVFAEASNGDLILATGSATAGVKFENLSNDAVGVIAMATQSGNATLSNQTYYPYSFTQSTPWNEFTLTDGYGTSSATYTLPELITNGLVIPAETLQESGTYYIDFGAHPFGSLENSSSTSASAVVLIVERRYYTSSGSYSYYTSRISNASYYGILPLTYRVGTTSVYLDENYDYRFRLYGHIKAFNDTSVGSGGKGMFGGFIKVVRIHKST